jgi:hypothetical protein
LELGKYLDAARPAGSSLACWALAGLGGCAPPPPLQLAEPGDRSPSIEIIHPGQSDEIELDATCVLTELIVVYVTGLELVDPKNQLVDGEGHWHGGPNLDRGYCFSAEPFCSGAPRGPLVEDYSHYDGTAMIPGLTTLYAELQDNLHGAIGVAAEVEVRLMDPGGHCSAVTGS